MTAVLFFVFSYATTEGIVEERTSLLPPPT